MGICAGWNYVVYPMFVYAVPSVVTSIAILFIMDVDSADVSEEEVERVEEGGGRRRGRGGGGGGNYGAVEDYD